MRDRNDRIVHLHLAAQAEQARQQHTPPTESATVLAYRNGLAFGRQLEWSKARTWWLIVGMTTGFLGGAATVVLTCTLLGVPPVL